ncbi:MAG: VOC family protein [Burkholderiaceae bacterium]|nr:VOC family protein [Burkholderiaceae bacterium]
MEIQMYLHFSGQCEAALSYYQKHLGAKTLFMMRFKDSPSGAETPPDWQNKIIHATFDIDGTHIMASDGMPGKANKEPHGFSLSVNPDSAAEAERIFKALSDNGQVTMPLQPTFFAAKFGMLIDQFDIPWMVHLEKD